MTISQSNCIVQLTEKISPLFGNCSLMKSSTSDGTKEKIVEGSASRLISPMVVEHPLAKPFDENEVMGHRFVKFLRNSL